jgi:hypothetical protein
VRDEPPDGCDRQAEQPHEARSLHPLTRMLRPAAQGRTGGELGDLSTSGVVP